MSRLDLLLGMWSLAAFAWWALALRLLYRATRAPAHQPPPAPADHLTVFKPLPPVIDGVTRDRIHAAVDSFTGQLDDRCTLLIGIPAGAIERWRPLMAACEGYDGPGHIRTLILKPPQQRPNPKVAWLEQMAAEARSGIWLWSDADVLAPPGLLTNLRAELGLGSARAVTCAYYVRQVCSAAHALDALFVNLEFLPGALLLGRRRTLDFAFGAVVIFPAVEFHRHVSWADLGRELADDHALGRRLAPVALSTTLVETLPTTGGMTEAFKHYYRWQKTVRWCRPLGYAALLLILPLAGWTLRLLTGPTPLLAGAALATVWMAEVGVASAAFRILGCPVPGRAWITLGVWPALRLLAWLSVWLPFPVVWGGADPLWKSRRKSVFGQRIDPVARRLGPRADADAGSLPCDSE